MLRYEAPSPVQARYVARDIECLRPDRSPKVRSCCCSTVRRTATSGRFPDADRFDIHRSGGHLSFGQGLHFCLGSALARMQARVVLEEVLKRWPDWEVDYDNAAMAHTSSVRGWGKLPVDDSLELRPWAESTPRNIVSRTWMSDGRVPRSRRMFSGIQPTPMTHRASISFDGLSILISPDRMPSASSDFICRTRLVNNQPGIRGVRGRLAHPCELDPELVAESVQRVGVDPTQRVQLLDR